MRCIRFWWIAALLGACVVGDGEVSDPGGGGPDAGTSTGADAEPGAADGAPVGGSPDGGGGGGGDTSCYSEPVDPDVSIDDIVAAYGGADWKDELIEAMDRRHPATGWLLEQQRDDSYFNQFSDSSSWTGMVGWLDTLSHEETHLFNAYHAIDVGAVHSLYFRDDLVLYLPSDPGFARGEIFDDLTSAARGGIYAPTYLQGSQGQRGFNELLDEASCYANEVAAVGPVGEYFPGGVSLRDGSVAFLYFIQVYLRVARTEHPSVYDQLKAEEVYREAVLTLWLRTHYFLEIADEYPELGIDDDIYRTEMYRPENLAEIEMFTGHVVGASSCVLD